MGRVPESWIPPEWILELRSKVRLRHTLIKERGEWQQRIQAQLYHHGVPRRRQLLVGERRGWLEALELPDSARRQIQVALAMIDAVDQQLEPLDSELRALARRQPGCRALMVHYGIGEITSIAILAGLVLGGWIVAQPGWGIAGVAAVTIAISGAALALSRRIPLAPAPDPRLRINWNPVTETWRNLRFLGTHRTVFLSVLGISWFWFYGAALVTQFPNLSRNVLAGNEHVVTLLLVSAEDGPDRVAGPYFVTDLQFRCEADRVVHGIFCLGPTSADVAHGVADCERVDGGYKTV